MARGNYSKDVIAKRLVEVFDGAFIYGKEVRIPMEEDGVQIQIKVSFTTAKDNVENPGAGEANDLPWDGPAKKEPTPEVLEEKEKVENLLKRLGI